MTMTSEKIRFRIDDKRVTKPVAVDISFGDGLWACECRLHGFMGIFAHANTRDDALTEAQKQFTFIWTEYAMENDEYLTLAAIELKQKLLKLVEDEDETPARETRIILDWLVEVDGTRLDVSVHFATRNDVGCPMDTARCVCVCVFGYYFTRKCHYMMHAHFYNGGWDFIQSWSYDDGPPDESFSRINGSVSPSETTDDKGGVMFGKKKREQRILELEKVVEEMAAQVFNLQTILEDVIEKFNKMGAQVDRIGNKASGASTAVNKLREKVNNWWGEGSK